MIRFVFDAQAPCALVAVLVLNVQPLLSECYRGCTVSSLPSKTVSTYRFRAMEG
jgi:hypothetical protein